MIPTPGIAEKAHGIFLIATMGLGFVAALMAEDTFAPLDASVLDGSWAAAWEDRLDDGFAPAEWGVTFWGVIEYAVFHQGRPGVVIGEDDWLFTAEEFEHHPDRQATIARNLDRIAEVQAKLDARGVRLVVALLPAKARIYDDKVQLPDYARAAYPDMKAALASRGVAVVDLEAPLREARQTADVFCATDTHWTPYGAHVAARSVAAAVSDWTPPSGGHWESRQEGELTVEGDLLAYVPLGPWQGSLGPGPETVPDRVVEGAPPAAGGLFGDVEIPVTVVGTSYTADERWGFADELKAALQADVLAAASEGAGPFEPMRDYLQDESFLQTPPQLIVWEVPERYLPVAVEDGGA